MLFYTLEPTIVAPIWDYALQHHKRDGNYIMLVIDSFLHVNMEQTCHFRTSLNQCLLVSSRLDIKWLICLKTEDGQQVGQSSITTFWCLRYGTWVGATHERERPSSKGLLVINISVITSLYLHTSTQGLSYVLFLFKSKPRWVHI